MEETHEAPPMTLQERVEMLESALTSQIKFNQDLMDYLRIARMPGVRGFVRTVALRDSGTAQKPEQGI